MENPSPTLKSKWQSLKQQNFQTLTPELLSQLLFEPNLNNLRVYFSALPLGNLACLTQPRAHNRNGWGPNHQLRDSILPDLGRAIFQNDKAEVPVPVPCWIPKDQGNSEIQRSEIQQRGIEIATAEIEKETYE